VWHTYKETDPIYRYREGDEIKFYRPYADKKNKFRSNYSILIEGLQNLQYKTDVLFISKSMKDVMTLHELHYESISVKSETTLVPDYIIHQLKDKYKKIYVFFDNDDAGVKNSIKLTSLYGLDYINIPKSYKEKDPFDFVKSYSQQELKELIDSKVYL
jgi:5S rRNA maturation endonuclease (ribonuclease M5)